jgi:acyl dehydratase
MRLRETMTEEDEESLYAQDIAVGDTSPEMTITNLTRTDFVKYAGASGDFNPNHHNEVYAREAGHSSVFAQGMLIAGFASQMVTDWFGLSAIQQFRTRFRARVWPGDTITVTGEVTSVSTEEAGATVEADIRVLNQDEESVVTGDVTVELPFRTD